MKERENLHWRVYSLHGFEARRRRGPMGRGSGPLPNTVRMDPRVYKEGGEKETYDSSEQARCLWISQVREQLSRYQREDAPEQIAACRSQLVTHAYADIIVHGHLVKYLHRIQGEDRPAKTDR